MSLSCNMVSSRVQFGTALHTVSWHGERPHTSVTCLPPKQKHYHSHDCAWTSLPWHVTFNTALCKFITPVMKRVICCGQARIIKEHYNWAWGTWMISWNYFLLTNYTWYLCVIVMLQSHVDSRQIAGGVCTYPRKWSHTFNFNPLHYYLHSKGGYFLCHLFISQCNEAVSKEKENYTLKINCICFFNLQYE